MDWHWKINDISKYEETKTTFQARICYPLQDVKHKAPIELIPPTWRLKDAGRYTQ